MFKAALANIPRRLNTEGLAKAAEIKTGMQAANQHQLPLNGKRRLDHD